MMRASAKIPMHKRGNVEKSARQYRETSATTPRRQREDAEAPSPRCQRFVATLAIRLDVAGCSCLRRA
jgi:hypothetical protein